MKTRLKIAHVLAAALALAMFHAAPVQAAPPNMKNVYAGFSIGNPRSLCRGAEIVSVRAKIVAPSWAAYGIAPATTANWLSAVDLFKTRACALRPSARDVWAALKQMGRAREKAVYEIVKVYDRSVRDAVITLDLDTDYQLSRIVEKCGNTIKGVADYVASGTGTLNDAALGHGCDMGKTPTQIRTGANIMAFGMPGVVDCATKYAGSQSECGGWEGSDPGEDDPEPPPDTKPCENCTPSEEEPDKDAAKADELEAVANDFEQGAAGLGAASALLTYGAKAVAFDPPAAAFTEGLAIGTGAAAGLCYLTAVGLRAYADYVRHRSGSQMCPSTNFSTGPAFMPDRQGQPLTMNDVVGGCLCEQLGAKAKAQHDLASEWGVPQLTSQGFCPDAGEQKSLACMADPYGPNDGIRKECAAGYSKINGEVGDAQVAELCFQIQCPAMQSGRATIKSPGNIACACGMNLDIPPGSIGGIFDRTCFQIRCGDGFAIVGPLGHCQCPTDDTGGGIGGPGGGGGGDPDPGPGW